jgi:hypothetical protein
VINEEFENQLNELLEELSKDPEKDYESMVISNKWIPKNLPKSYFMFTLSKEGISYEERTEFTHLTYDYSLTTHQLKINNELKDPSFSKPFFTKMNEIPRLLNKNEASLFFKERDEK